MPALVDDDLFLDYEMQAVLAALGATSLSRDRLVWVKTTIASILMRHTVAANARTDSMTKGLIEANNRLNDQLNEAIDKRESAYEHQIIRNLVGHTDRTFMVNNRDPEDLGNELDDAFRQYKQELSEAHERLNHFWLVANDLADVIRSFEPTQMPEGPCWCLRFPDAPPDEQECTAKQWCAKIRKAIETWTELSKEWPKPTALLIEEPVEAPKPEAPRFRCGKRYYYGGDLKACRLATGHSGGCDVKDSVP